MGRLYGLTARSLYLLVSSHPSQRYFPLFNITTYSAELCASVNGFSKNCYCCCKSIEEGRQALQDFLARQATTSSTPITQIAPRPKPLKRRRLIIPTDHSWWCCFVGAEPGVYHGL